MPNAVSDGKINWQVSSGKSTSFYKYYKARWIWWEQKANALGLPGKGNENERFTVAARLINPTGYRACRLCGEDWNVGYFYLNDRFYKKLKTYCTHGIFFKWQPIDSAIHELKKYLSSDELKTLFIHLFPERTSYFNEFGVSKEAFEKSNHINAKAWLTPGFMGNPPDRLDGFHDYHFECRKNHDPGRFEANMKTYNHDRRSFEYWAEGDWMVSDILYNNAGIGICLDCPKDSKPQKISPDHVGPISCGFKQLDYYKPLCSRHNSTKNRRFNKYDIELLIAFEQKNNISVASRQIRFHWDKNKNLIKTDEQAKNLSNSLRSIQDAYFRILYLLWKKGYARFICSLLSPENAFNDVKFINLDPSNLSHQGFEISKKITPNRRSLFVRSIRIALNSLINYVSKTPSERKLVRKDFENNSQAICVMLERLSKIEKSPIDELWAKEIPVRKLDSASEELIGKLTDFEEVPKMPYDDEMIAALNECLALIGQANAF